LYCKYLPLITTLDPVALLVRKPREVQVEVDRAHDAVAELLVNQRLEGEP